MISQTQASFFKIFHFKITIWGLVDFHDVLVILNAVGGVSSCALQHFQTLSKINIGVTVYFHYESHLTPF